VESLREHRRLRAFARAGRTEENDHHARRAGGGVAGEVSGIDRRGRQRTGGPSGTALHQPMIASASCARLIG
jgi:hypothetical protein